jgi:hypothetical protein
MLTDNSSKIEGMKRFRGMAGSSSSGQTRGLAGLSVVPDSEAPEKSVRRRFTAEYKLLILRKAGDKKEQGRLGALLHREVLRSSNLATR